MNLELLFNKRLRRIFKQAITIETKEECTKFFDELIDRDKSELISYIECCEIPSRKREARTLNKYIFLHYNDYLSAEEIQSNRRANCFVNLAWIIIICIACIMTYFTS